jgi:hypothetical protein
MQKIPAVLDQLRDGIIKARTSDVTIILLTPPNVVFPPEVAPLLCPIEYGLPNDSELEDLLKLMQGDNDKNVHQLLSPETIAQAVVAGRGLTRHQFSSIVATEYTEKRLARGTTRKPAWETFDPYAIWEAKAKLAAKEGMLEIHQDKEGLVGLAGLDFLKDTVVPLLRKGKRLKIALLSPPGLGKTQIAKRIGFDIGLPTLIVDLSAIFQKYVGESEARTRALHAQIERMSPCVVVLDEFSRYLSTDGASHDSGTGVDQKVGAQWLQWLSSEASENCVIVATANSLDGVTTMIRAGRFDMTLYASIERTTEQYEAVWELYRQKFNLPEQEFPDSPRITPVEQMQICKFASDDYFNDTIMKAAERIVLVSDTQDDSIKSMEEYGKQKFLNIETGVRFTRPAYRAAMSRSTGRKLGAGAD